MNRENFHRQLERLVLTYGKTAYSDERVKLLWREVSDFPDHWFERLVDQFIGANRQAPLLNEFREEIAKLREREHQDTKHSSHGIPWNRFSCSFCGGNGVYLCKHPDRGGVWAFRCHCDFGERDPRKGIPQFKQAHADEGFRYYDIQMHQHEMRLIQGER